jgi:hypothetical protein
MVVSIPVGEEELRLVASPIKIDGWAPAYRPPPLLQDRRSHNASDSGPVMAAPGGG